MKETTAREKSKLFQSHEYKEAVLCKGSAQREWNWQTREKEDKVGQERVNTTQQFHTNKAKFGQAPKLRD